MDRPREDLDTDVIRALIARPTAEAGAAAVTMFVDGGATRELLGTFVVRGSTGAVRSRRANARSGGERRPSGDDSG